MYTCLRQLATRDPCRRRACMRAFGAGEDKTMGPICCHDVGARKRKQLPPGPLSGVTPPAICTAPSLHCHVLSWMDSAAARAARAALPPMSWAYGTAARALRQPPIFRHQSGHTMAFAPSRDMIRTGFETNCNHGLLVLSSLNVCPEPPCSSCQCYQEAYTHTILKSTHFQPLPRQRLKHPWRQLVLD